MESRSLWKNRDFTIFWFAQTLSVAGDSFSYVALPLLVLHATGSVAQMGLLTGVSAAGSIIAGVFAGVVADRVRRRTLLIVCDVARFVLYALIPVVWWFSPQIWLLYVVVPLAAAFAMVFRVGYVAAVPYLVGADRITEANGRLSGTYAAAWVGGPMLAGITSGVFGPTAAVAIDACTFAVSAIGLSFIRPRTRPSEPPSRVSVRDFFVGAQFLWKHPVLRSLTVLLAFLAFLTTGLTDIYVYYVGHQLNQPDRTVGYVLAAGAVGTIIAAFLVSYARRTLGFGACWIGSYAVSGFAIACIGLSTSVPVIAGLVTVVVFGTSMAGICSLSLRQEVTPDHLLGRVTSAFWTIHTSLGPIGAAVLTVGVARYGVRALLLGAGSVCLLIAVAASLTPIRQARPEAAPAMVD